MNIITKIQNKKIVKCGPFATHAERTPGTTSSAVFVISFPLLMNEYHLFGVWSEAKRIHIKQSNANREKCPPADELVDPDLRRRK